MTTFLRRIQFMASKLKQRKGLKFERRKELTGRGDLLEGAMILIKFSKE